MFTISNEFNILLIGRWFLQMICDDCSYNDQVDQHEKNSLNGKEWITLQRHHLLNHNWIILVGKLLIINSFLLLNY